MILLYQGNNLDSLKKLKENSIDSIVTDPPYGLSFMNKKWDHSVPSVEFWRECLRVLKPGGHVLSFGGTRTYHRMAVNIEDAGFEIRDQIMWLYGSGFPKSQNVSKMIDKKFGCEREVVGSIKTHDIKNNSLIGKVGSIEVDITKPSSDQAKQWDGFGTALKPANEPIVLARKPLSEKTIVDNVLKWGTGAINIDGCRVGSQTRTNSKSNDAAKGNGIFGEYGSVKTKVKDYGRWPANIILDEQAAFVLDEQSGPIKTKLPFKKTNDFTFGVGDEHVHKGQKFESQKGLGITVSGASRFFYVAKASKSERNRGLEGLPLKEIYPQNNSIERKELNSTANTKSQNHHPTVKPIKLMEYLVKLITPPSGVCLDPFMGSGSTGVACKNLGFDFVGMELDEDYFNIAKKRIENF